MVYTLHITSKGIMIEAEVDIPLVGRKRIMEILGDEIKARIVVDGIKIVRNNDGKVVDVILNIVELMVDETVSKPENFHKLTGTYYLGNDGHLYQYDSKKKNFRRILPKDRLYIAIQSLKASKMDYNRAKIILRTRTPFTNMRENSIKQYLYWAKLVINNGLEDIVYRNVRG